MNRDVARTTLVMAGSLVAILLGILDARSEEPFPDAVAVINGRPLHADAVLSIGGAAGVNPTDEELAWALEQAIESELVFQTAEALDFMRSDSVLRGRAVQLVRDFAASGGAGHSPPSEAELRAFYAENQEHFRTAAEVRFEEIYLRSANQGRIDAVRAELERGASRESLVRGTDRPPVQWGDGWISVHEIERHYGREIAEAATDSQIARWSGALRSGRGVHFIRVVDRHEAHVLPFEEVRTRVAEQVRTRRRGESIVEWTRRTRGSAEVEVLPEAVARIRQATRSQERDSAGLHASTQGQRP